MIILTISDQNLRKLPKLEQNKFLKVEMTMVLLPSLNNRKKDCVRRKPVWPPANMETEGNSSARGGHPVLL